MEPQKQQLYRAQLHKGEPRSKCGLLNSEVSKGRNAAAQLRYSKGYKISCDVCWCSLALHQRKLCSAVAASTLPPLLLRSSRLRNCGRRQLRKHPLVAQQETDKAKRGPKRPEAHRKPQGEANFVSFVQNNPKNKCKRKIKVKTVPSQ